MLWKVYNINTGRTIKAGFDSEDLARDWLESRSELQETNYDIDEMDHDEEDEYREAKASSEEPEELEEDYLADEAESQLQMSFDDSDEDADQGIIHEFDPDEED